MSCQRSPAGSSKHQHHKVHASGNCPHSPANLPPGVHPGSLAECRNLTLKQAVLSSGAILSQCPSREDPAPTVERRKVSVSKYCCDSQCLQSSRDQQHQPDTCMCHQKDTLPDHCMEALPLDIGAALHNLRHSTRHCMHIDHLGHTVHAGHNPNDMSKAGGNHGQ